MTEININFGIFLNIEIETQTRSWETSIRNDCSVETNSNETKSYMVIIGASTLGLFR